jgi:hypothetical protein
MVSHNVIIPAPVLCGTYREKERDRFSEAHRAALYINTDICQYGYVRKKSKNGSSVIASEAKQSRNSSDTQEIATALRASQ